MYENKKFQSNENNINVIPTKSKIVIIPSKRNPIAHQKDKAIQPNHNSPKRK
jgi:hypothetical protein